MSPDNSDIGTSIFPVVKVLRIIPEDQKMAKTALPAGISAFGVLAYSPHEMSIRRIGDPRSAIRSYNSMTEGIITLSELVSMGRDAVPLAGLFGQVWEYPT